MVRRRRGGQGRDEAGWGWAVAASLSRRGVRQLRAGALARVVWSLGLSGAALGCGCHEPMANTTATTKPAKIQGSTSMWRAGAFQALLAWAEWIALVVVFKIGLLAVALADAGCSARPQCRFPGTPSARAYITIPA